MSHPSNKAKWSFTPRKSRNRDSHKFWTSFTICSIKAGMWCNLSTNRKDLSILKQWLQYYRASSSTETTKSHPTSESTPSKSEKSWNGVKTWTKNKPNLIGNTSWSRKENEMSGTLSREMSTAKSKTNASKKNTDASKKWWCSSFTWQSKNWLRYAHRLMRSFR